MYDFIFFMSFYILGFSKYHIDITSEKNKKATPFFSHVYVYKFDDKSTMKISYLIYNEVDMLNLG